MRIAICVVLLVWPVLVQGSGRPKILRLTAQDHGPHLGCYGDGYAVTPQLDAFAERSLLYTRASSTAPICAPARTTIISGMYGPALGGQHMRSEVPRPAWLRFSPEILREAGYYCTSNIAEANPGVVARFREALQGYFIETRDIGLLPESLFHELSRAGEVTPADFARSDALDAESVAILKASNTRPGNEWPKRVAGYPGRLNPTVVKQFAGN